MAKRKMFTNRVPIHELLTKEPPTRDSDIVLFARLVQSGPQRVNLEAMTAYQLLVRMNDGSLPHFESVRRTRQKLQEEYPALRGDRYAQRQRKSRDVRGEVIAQTNASALAATQEAAGMVAP